MIWGLLLALGWLACSVGAYLGFRRVVRMVIPPWTKSNRYFFLLWSLLLGSGALVGSLLISLIEGVWQNNEEASW